MGAGPAGLMAAETVASAGVAVEVHDRMPSPARKFLMAGRGGLNLTHSESLERFMERYGTAEPALLDAVRAFPPSDLAAWCEALGQPTFVGSSGRIFPVSMKASPLTRAWLGRLDALGVRFVQRSRFSGWNERGLPLLDRGDGPQAVEADATLLALGGASWPRLGSDGRWVETLASEGIAVSPLRPSNMGVEIAWSAHLRERHIGEPLKRIAVSVGGRRVPGEAILTASGLEGGAIYALSPEIRRAFDTGGQAELTIDLRPDLAPEALVRRLSTPRSSSSLSTHLRKRAALSPAAIAILRESALARGAPLPQDPAPLAAAIKAVPLSVTGMRGLDRAISTAGGIAFAEIDPHFMLRKRPGTFVAGEMLDWDAPTGGYLLQASMATGRAAGQGILRWLESRRNGG
jgi:uncharacterized flavoprotein (TIGR03862 family)